MRDSAIEKSYDYKVSSKDKTKHFLNGIVKFITDLMFIILLAFLLIILFYNLYVKKYGTPDKPPLVTAYVIISPSMVPTINVLDAVVSVRPDTDKVNSGDIITFDSGDARYKGLTVTHRVVKADGVGKERIFNTKGDNNTTPDATTVSAKNVLGKVVFVIPFLGYLQFFLTKYYGWILLVVLPCIAMIAYDVYKLSNAIKRSKVTKNIKFKDVEIKDDVDKKHSAKNKTKDEKKNEKEIKNKERYKKYDNIKEIDDILDKLLDEVEDDMEEEMESEVKSKHSKKNNEKKNSHSKSKNDEDSDIELL